MFSDSGRSEEAGEEVTLGVDSLNASTLTDLCPFSLFPVHLMSSVVPTTMVFAARVRVLFIILSHYLFSLLSPGLAISYLSSFVFLYYFT